MRQDWNQWQPPRYRNEATEEPFMGPGQGRQMGGPSLPQQYQTLPNQQSMSLDNGSVLNQGGSPYGNTIPPGYGSSVFDVQPQYGNPAGGIVPPGYGSPGVSQYGNSPAQGSQPHYGNPSVMNAGMSVQGQGMGQPNQWASIGRQSSAQPQSVQNWWSRASGR